MCINPRLCILLLAALVALAGCASVFDHDGASTVIPYTIEESGRIIIDVHINGQGPFKFVLDTAASISAIFDRLRDKLALDIIPDQTVTIRGAVATEQFPLLDVDLLEVGNEFWANPRIVSIPGKTAAGNRIDGVLGVDFLRMYAIGFSAKDRIIRLYPPHLVADRSYRGWASIPLQVEPAGVGDATLSFLRIAINGREITALFDLGSGLNLLNWHGARKLGIDPARLRKDQIVSGVLESTTALARLHAEEVTTAHIGWRNEVFLIADLEIFSTLMLSDGPAVILGAGFFTQRDFVIDFVRSRLLIKTAMKEMN